MHASRNKPSVLGGIFLSLFGIAWFSIAMHWAMQQQFRFGKRAPLTIVTPESHPIFFWCWLSFCCGVGIVTFARGIMELRAFVRLRRAELESIQDDRDGAA